MDHRNIIIFDGVCNFCNGSVNYIIKRDPNEIFAFTPMQSDLAIALLKNYGIKNVGVDTFLLIKNDICYIWTDAALEIAKDLDGHSRWFTLLSIIPRPIRDWFYRLFARNRYALFGKTNKCMVPTPELQRRFVGINITRKSI